MVDYISHIRVNENGQEIIQTNKIHTQNVASYAGKWGKALKLENLCVLIGLLHDQGKYTRAFDNYILNSFRHHDTQQKGKIDHSTAGAKFIYDCYKNGTENERMMAEWSAMAIMSHHTGLQNFLSINGTSDFLRRTLSEPENYQEAQTAFFQDFPKELIIGIAEKAKKEVSECLQKIDVIARDDDEYYFFLGMIEKMIFSILIDADRLDTANFMTDMNLEQTWDENALWNDFSQKLEYHLAAFPKVTDPQMKRIVDARQKISDDCLSFAINSPGIYRLSVPTGSGKTLASMRYALVHANKYKKKRIIVIIPYTSVIDQNAHEIEDIFKNPNVILEHHSNVISDIDSMELVDGKNVTASGDDTYSKKAELHRAFTERWDVPIIFTTQVQFLNTLFAGRTRSVRRLHALQDSLIIFDEIQTLPVKCTCLFNEALNFLKNYCNVTAVLCTATQPDFNDAPVPLQLSQPSEMVGNLDRVFNAFKRVRIENMGMDGGNDVDDLVPLIWQDAIKRGNVLCIVNTTTMAKKIYKSMLTYAKTNDEEILILHLSTKMCPMHRKNILKVMRRLLIKKRNNRLICISTQLIEAGVDISFTTVYRDIAGLSSVAQAAGRCNRHGEMPYGLVRIIDLKGENLSYLQDIKKGQDAMRDMLPTVCMDSILQPESIHEYFERYNKFFSIGEKKYLLKDGKENIFDILSDNDGGDKAFYVREGQHCSLENFQAFHDAGREFCVIDTQTISVLVPYGKGKQYISKFNDDNYDLKKINKLLKESQQFMVNLFSYEVKRLAEFGAIKETESGVLYLREEYYDKRLGVVSEEQKNEFNIC